MKKEREKQNRKEKIKNLVRVLIREYQYKNIIKSGYLLKVNSKNRWWKYGEEYLFLTAPNEEGGMKSGHWFGWRFNIGKKGTVIHSRSSDMWMKPEDYIEQGYTEIELPRKLVQEVMYSSF